MNRFVQFCLKPTPQDRGIWCLVQLTLACLCFVTGIFSFFGGHWINGSFNAFFCIFNGFFGFINNSIYNEWYNKNNPDGTN